MMKRLLFMLVLFFSTAVLTGCATYIQANNQCANPSLRFADTVSCINKETDGSTNAYAVSYRLTANQLLEQLNAGNISETTAKMKLQDKFMSLQRDLNSDDAMYCIASGKSSAFCY